MSELLEGLDNLLMKARLDGIEAERERINGIIEQFIENSDYPEVVSSLEWLQDVIGGENK